MNFKVRLSQRILLNDVHEIIQFIHNDADRKQELYDLLFDANPSIGYNAGWIFSHFSTEEMKWLYDKQDALIDQLFTCSHPGKRRLLLTLLYRQPFADPIRVDFLDYCFERMIAKHELPWSQALCIKIAYELCRSIPELCGELRSQLEIMEPSMLTSSQRGVRESVLKAMKIGKTLQRF